MTTAQQHANRRSYYAVEFLNTRPRNPLRPTTNFDRALRAAETEADRRQSAVTIYRDGHAHLIVQPSQQAAAAEYGRLARTV